MPVMQDARGRVSPNGSPTNGRPAATFPPIRHIRDLVRPPGERWLVEGYLARGKMTLLTALWKVGKTTWLAHMLKGFRGGGTFCGRHQSPARVLYVTEEDDDLWVDRRGELGLGDCPIHVLTRPFGFGRPNAARWSEFLYYLAEFQAGETPADVVVLDTLSGLWPVSDENDAARVGEALAPLRMMTAQEPYPSLLLNHHNRKSDGPEFTATRGSGALPAFVDVILEMRRFDPVDDDNAKRVIKGGGRFHKHTPAELVVELTDAGYEACGSRGEVIRATVVDVIADILADGARRTWQGVRDDWPGDRAPRIKTLLDALRDGSEAGRWHKTGEGRRNCPYLYWIGPGEAPIPD